MECPFPSHRPHTLYLFTCVFSGILSKLCVCVCHAHVCAHKKARGRHWSFFFSNSIPESYSNAWLFTWIMGIQIEVLMLAQQAFLSIDISPPTQYPSFIYTLLHLHLLLWNPGSHIHKASILNYFHSLVFSCVLETASH